MRENVNYVIYNFRILLNLYFEVKQLKKQDKEYLFVYDCDKEELYRVRIRLKFCDGGREYDFCFIRLFNFVEDLKFFYSIDELFDDLGYMCIVGMQMSIKYIVQEFRLKVIVRDVGI